LFIIMDVEERGISWLAPGDWLEDGERLTRVLKAMPFSS
jgi:hypothetical protein